MGVPNARKPVQEKRKHPRKVLDIPVGLAAIPDGERIAAICHDVSLGGMFLLTDAKLPFGTLVHVFVSLPRTEGEAALEGTVRWVKNDGLGVQFGLLGARETYGLMELLR